MGVKFDIGSPKYWSEQPLRYSTRILPENEHRTSVIFQPFPFLGRTGPELPSGKPRKMYLSVCRRGAISKDLEVHTTAILKCAGYRTKNAA